MKALTLSFFALGLLLASGTSHALENPTIPGSAFVLVEEQTEEAKPAPKVLVITPSSSFVVGSMPVLSAGVRGQVDFNQRVELGGELGALPIGVFIPYAGAYINLAPLPGMEIKHFYISGHVYRAWIRGAQYDSNYRADSQTLGIGFRWHNNSKTLNFVELGVGRGHKTADPGCVLCDEVIANPDFKRLWAAWGFRF